jgi:hypothetical protein
MMDEESGQAGEVSDELASHIPLDDSSDDDLVHVLDEMKETISQPPAFNPMEDKQTLRPPLPTELTVIPPADEPQTTFHAEEALPNADESDESTGQVESNAFKTKGVGNYVCTLEKYNQDADTYTLSHPDDTWTGDMFNDVVKLIPKSWLAKEHIADVNAISCAYLEAFDTACCMSASSVSIANFTEPANFRKAMVAPDCKEWKDACDSEMGTLERMRCWEIVDESTMPPDAELIDPKCHFF